MVKIRGGGVLGDFSGCIKSDLKNVFYIAERRLENREAGWLPRGALIKARTEKAIAYLYKYDCALLLGNVLRPVPASEVAQVIKLISDFLYAELDNQERTRDSSEKRIIARAIKILITQVKYISKLGDGRGRNKKKKFFPPIILSWASFKQLRDRAKEIAEYKNLKQS
jgi:hypothetical protein